jgi:prepilin peptidase CpaA
MSAPTFIIAVPVLAILAVATFSDLRARRIPNGLSLGGAALGLLINVVTFGSTGAVLAVLGWALCLGCLIPLYISGGTAAGDVKLMAMVGAFLGPVNGFIACLLTLMAGALLASLCLAWRNFVAPRLTPRHELAGSNGNERRDAARFNANALDKIPYAGAIAVGSVAAVLQPAWVMTLLQ